MENKSKRIDVKIIIIVIITIIAIVEGIVIFTSNSGTLKEKDIIGTWESEDKEISIELYESGTGNKYDSVPLTWEIKGNIINITENHYNFGNKVVGYKVENNKITSVDGKEILYKSK